jgi:predicted transcriptional regulator
VNRRGVFLLRTETGWQVLGRQGRADGQEVAHYFDQEDDARAMLVAVPPELSDWAKMTQLRSRRPFDP